MPFNLGGIAEGLGSVLDPIANFANSVAPVVVPVLQQAGVLNGGGFRTPGIAGPIGGRMPTILPGGARTMSGGLMQLPFIDVVPQGGGATLSALTSPFLPTRAGFRAQPFISQSPDGRVEWFRPAGRPVLFSKDISVARQVKKRCRKVVRSLGG